MKKRIFLISFQLEASSFTGSLTTMEDFRRRGLSYGRRDAGLSHGHNSFLSGFYDALCPFRDVELLMGPVAVASPGGPVSEEAFDRITELIIEDFQAYQKESPVDGCLLALHGAMMTERFEDAESEVLRRLRKVAGEIPMVLSLDFHVNLTQEMLDLTEGIFVSKYYPHTDFNERGRDAARFLYRILEEGLKPVHVLSKLPFIFPIRSTYEEPFASLISEMLSEREDPSVLDVTLAGGFYLSDTVHNRPAVYALTDSTEAKAQALTDKYEAKFMAHPEVFDAAFPAMEDAVREAIENPGLTVFGDGSDNTGSGCYGDDTTLLMELIRQGARDVALAYLTDPESVVRCIESGVGSTVSLSLGGKSKTAMGEPVLAEAEVLFTSEDFRVTHTGVMYHGGQNRLGPCAVIRFSGITVILSTYRTQPMDENVFLAFGINPRKMHILVVKSAIHYQAAFRELTERVITLAVNDITPLEPKKLTYQRALQGVRPLNV